MLREHLSGELLGNVAGFLSSSFTFIARLTSIDGTGFGNGCFVMMMMAHEV